MRVRTLLAGAILVAALVTPALAQTKQKLNRIGVLTPASVQFDREAFRRALVRRGYVEGSTITLSVVSAEGRLERLPSLAQRLGSENIDLIVAINSPAVRAILATATTVPLVMGMVSDPVVLGLASNLSRPDRRMTGVLNVSHDLATKRLALLKEAAPRVARVAAFYHPDDPITAPQREEISAAAPRLGLNVSFFPVRNAEETRAAFGDAHTGGVDALFVLAGQSGTIGVVLAELGLRHRLPAAVTLRQQVEGGALMSYFADLAEHWDRLASQVDRVLRGAAPEDLPFEQPSKFELVVNARTARAIGLDLPSSILARADEVIE
jgi:putative tryptophan/tyrosine transport system substrate-binding protein